MIEYYCALFFTARLISKAFFAKAILELWVIQLISKVDLTIPGRLRFWIQVIEIEVIKIEVIEIEVIEIEVIEIEVIEIEEIEIGIEGSKTLWLKVSTLSARQWYHVD